MSKINNNNYFSIHGWMVNELNLQGNELMTYAIIYGFSQTEGTKFTGSINYLCDFTNSSRTTIIKCLKNLTEKKLIIKNQKNINGVIFNEYQANLYLVKNLNWGSQETKQGVVKNFNGGSKETVPNNKDNNKEDNKDDNKIINDEKTIEEEFEILWTLYPNKKGVQKARDKYYKLRKNNPNLFHEVEEGINNYIGYINKNKIQHQYIKHGSTFFNNQSWLDDYDEEPQRQLIPRNFEKEFGEIVDDIDF